MAIQSIHIGPVEDFLQFDDTEFYSDTTTPRGLIVPVVPTTSNGVLRLADLSTAVNPLIGLSYVVMALTGTLTAERKLTAGTGVTLTDGGANGNATLSIGQAVGTADKPTFAGVILTDHADIDADNKALRLGADQDATLLYDGTDLLINPQAVGTGKATIQGVVNTTEHYQVDGTQVVTNQQAAEADLAGGATLADVITKVNNILAKLRTHGLIAT